MPPQSSLRDDPRYEPGRADVAMPRFLTARWIHLAMLNYEIDPAVLAPRVPRGIALDSYDGATFVSMVGFQFLDTCVAGVRVPFHRHFDEVNLRFYVRRETSEGARRGVVFVKEIVPRRAIAWLARRLYNENYIALPMSHEDEIGRAVDPRVVYRWTFRGRPQHLSVRATGEPSLPGETSEESFITEHYWGYVSHRSGGTLEYQVEHPRWNVWRVSAADLRCDVAELYSADFAPFLSGRPSSAFLAEGSAVVVRRGRILGDELREHDTSDGRNTR